MAQKDSPNKVALSKLRGKSCNQSVPSFSFRFNTTSENITEILEAEDDSLLKKDNVSETATDALILDDQSPKCGSKLLSQRSVSLDSNQGGTDIPSPKGNESSSLLSRLAKTFEHKFSEIRSEKLKEPKSSKELAKEPKNVSKADAVDESKNAEDKGKIEKPKTSLVQDLSEHTNKLKLEFRDSIRPKFTELRNRKTNKDTAKARTSLLATLLGREALTSEEVVGDCEQAIEAQEDTVELMPKVLLPLAEKEVGFTDKRLSDEVKRSTIVNECKSAHNSLLNVSNSFFYKIVFLLFLSFLIVPLNVMLGFVIGIILGGISCFYYLLNVPQHITYKSQEKEIHNLQIPVFEENSPFEGWMNELSEAYSPDTYHVCQTHSVYVRLQGSVLKIDHPQRKVSKHARSNEELDCGSFVHHREYDMKECEVMLLPVNLPRRWLWSRKYPIFIQIRKKDAGENTSPNSIVATPQDSTDQEFDNHDEFLKNESLADDDLMTSSVELDSYEEVTAEMCQEKSLTLFARSDREKDDWFRRFVDASQNSVIKTAIEDNKTPENEAPDLTPSEEQTPTEEYKKDERQKLDFSFYMALLQQNNRTPINIGWFNSLVGRIFFDFLHSQYWANKIQERIQRKLSKLHLPYFVGEIIVCGVDLGTTIPILLSAERPSVNERGVWVDLAMSYNGSLTLSLETKLDLMKLKERSGINVATNPPSPTESSRTYSVSPSNDCVLHNISYDTDTDDSIESSSEEECEEDAALESSFRGSGGPASKRLLRIVDTVTASKYFQQASEWRVLQRAMMGVSNTRIELCVEVKRLEGILTVNIPPPPSDRLWYGFRKMPELEMVAKPSLGQRPINLPFLTDYIEKELRTVFEKVFVLPNMDDLVIPVMSPLLPGQTPPPRPWENQHSSSPKSPTKEAKINVVSEAWKYFNNRWALLLPKFNKGSESIFTK